jgi:transposase
LIAAFLPEARSTERRRERPMREASPSPARAQPLSTVRASRPRKAVAHGAMTPATRSKGASDMPGRYRWQGAAGRTSYRRCPGPMSRIVMAVVQCCKYHAAYSRSSRRPGPMAVTIMSASRRLPASPLKSSAITGQTGFVVLPRRWVVERFFAWISRNRRLAKDVEATLKSAAAFSTLPLPCS